MALGISDMSMFQCLHICLEGNTANGMPEFRLARWLDQDMSFLG